MNIVLLLARQKKKNENESRWSEQKWKAEMRSDIRAAASTANLKPRMN